MPSLAQGRPRSGWVERMIDRRRALAASGAVLAWPAFTARAADAPTWRPTRPVRVIVPYPPGGVTDIVGRIGAEALGQALGQAVVVENRPGAGGNIGMAAAVREAPDGHCLLLGTAAMFGVNPVIHPNQPFDPLADFAGAGMLGEVANVLSVPPGRTRARSVAELVAEAKRRPMVFGSAGNGSFSHLSAATFTRTMGVEATHVPYRGGAPLAAAMLAGEVDFAFDTTTTSAANAQSGAIRALAVSTARRAPSLPDVPTLAEAGVAGDVLRSWMGFFVPAATPAPVLAGLRAAMGRTDGPATHEKLRRAFVDPFNLPTAELDGWWRQDSRHWQGVARGAGVRPD